MEKYESPTIEQVGGVEGGNGEGTWYEENIFVVGELAIYVVAAALIWATYFIAITIKVPAANLEPVSK